MADAVGARPSLVFSPQTPPRGPQVRCPRAPLVPRQDWPIDWPPRPQLYPDYFRDGVLLHLLPLGPEQD